MNEQIERALEGLQLDLDRLELRLEASSSAPVGVFVVAQGSLESSAISICNFTALAHPLHRLLGDEPGAFFEPSISTSRM